MPKSPSTKIRWKHVERYFEKRKDEGYEIFSQGGSKIIAGPIRPGKKMRPTVRIGKDCSYTSNAEVLKAYLKLIEINFSVTSQEILDDFGK